MKSPKNVFSTVIIALGLVSFFSTSAHAVSIFCSSNGGTYQEDSHNLLREDIYANCTALDMKADIDVENLRIQDMDLLDGHRLTLTLEGVGPGFRIGSDAFMINCPLIFKAEKLTKSSFKGVKITATALVGASVGVFVNQRLGACVMTSVNGGFGVGLSGASMTFETR